MVVAWPVPEEAPTAGLQGDEAYLEARHRFIDALDDLRATGTDVLDLEAAVNMMVFCGAAAPIFAGSRRRDALTRTSRSS